MSYELYEIDNELFALDPKNGDIFRIDFPNNEESKLEKNKNDLEEIKELSSDYKSIQMGASALKISLDNLAEKHGIQIRKKTRKDFVDKWRERKKSEELTEDMTSEEYIQRKDKIFQEREKSGTSMRLEDRPNYRLDFKEDKKGKDLKYGTKPNYALEC